MSEETDEVVRVADLVDYQEGSVVSRTLSKTRGGSVTLFAFDGGQGLSEHTSPFEALVQVLEGEAEITLEGKRHLVRAGEMIRMPANRPHALRAFARFKMILTMLQS